MQRPGGAVAVRGLQRHLLHQLLRLHPRPREQARPQPCRRTQLVYPGDEPAFRGAHPGQPAAQGHRSHGRRRRRRGCDEAREVLPADPGELPRPPGLAQGTAAAEGGAQGDFKGRLSAAANRRQEAPICALPASRPVRVRPSARVRLPKAAGAQDATAVEAPGRELVRGEEPGGRGRFSGKASAREAEGPQEATLHGVGRQGPHRPRPRHAGAAAGGANARQRVRRVRLAGPFRDASPHERATQRREAAV
mmetsp:Transcript_2829/g.6301  ORF Transcript_2829/g.6301 Transcript_2829/m.6301 type:complete len:250 (+) Transcript_2829:3318-4067(+)